MEKIFESFSEFFGRINEGFSQKEKDSIEQFIKDNPNPDDSILHKFAEDNKLNIHDVETYIYTLATKHLNELDQIPGGKGDKSVSSSLDEKELRVGIAVEKEHTNDETKAVEIATDHLTENPKYYSELIKAGIVDEEDALDLAVEIGLVKAEEIGINAK